MTVGGTTVWTDDVEAAPTAGPPGRALDRHHGRRLDPDRGTLDYEQYYLAEWRNFDGYDKGLKTPYATN